MRSPPLNRVSFAVAAVVFAFCASNANAQTLYGITVNGKLQTIATAGFSTGQATPVLPGSSSAGMQTLGLAFHPNGGLYTWDNSVRKFRKIDPATGQESAPIQVDNVPANLATPVSFAFNNAGAGFFVDASTPPRFFSFAFNNYWASNFTPLQANFPSRGLVFDNSVPQKLYAIGNSSQPNPPPSLNYVPDGGLWVVNTTFGTATLKVNLQISGAFPGDGSAWNALSFDPSSNAPLGYAIAPVGRTFAIDSSTGSTFPATLPVGIPITGIAFAPFVLPPPPPPPPPPPTGGGGGGGGGGGASNGGEGTYGIGYGRSSVPRLLGPLLSGASGQRIVLNVSHRPQSDGQPDVAEAPDASCWTVLTLTISVLAVFGCLLKKVLSL